MQFQHAFGFGVFLGASSAPPQNGVTPARTAPVFTVPENHSLIVARTRTGKGTRVIIPTLLRLFCSILTIDPKGENAAITARARKQTLKHTVHIVNPWRELDGHFQSLGLTPFATYNPLDVLDREDPNAVGIAQSLANTISPSNPGDKDRFWSGQAANVIAAVFLWLADQPGERKPSPECARSCR
ncbi:MAG: type IV secretory system conjugative DNA transfer family protein [Acidobacteria bacterium]|nr:type IV secretory system conjugative DNA transfer family protein [Acidobacteriota bacterium]